MKVYLDKPYNYFVHSLNALNALKTNFGNLEKIRQVAEDFNFRIYAGEGFGVCRVISSVGEVGNHLAKLFIEKHGNKGQVRNSTYPVGGVLEFDRPMFMMWTNPDRLLYIEHCIETFEYIVKNWDNVSEEYNEYH